MSKQKKEEGQRPKRDFINVYFIENHIQNEKVNIILSEKYNEADELKQSKSGKIESNHNSYIYTIYNFKVYTTKVKEKKLDIKIKIEADKGYKFEFNINITDFVRDLFVYDFKYEKADDFNPPLSVNLNNIQQFDIYLTFLRKTLKAVQNSFENEDFIFSTQKLLLGAEIKYEFSFYLMIFLECFTTKYVQRLLIIFRKDKIGSVGEIPPKKLGPMANVLKGFEKNPGRILDKIDEKSRDKYGKILVGIILFFNYNFNKERIIEVINQEALKLYMNKSLIEFSDLFKDLQFPADKIKNFINESKSSNEIINSLKYCKNVYELFNIILIDSNFRKICNICKSELEDKKEFEIDIESIVPIQSNDNIKNIYEIYILLFKLQKAELNYLFLRFKPTLCKKYISLFERKSVENLLYLKKLIDFIKSNDKNYEIQEKDINKIIEETKFKLMNESKTFKDIINSLNYCNGILELFEAILVDSNFKKICDICKSELNKNKKPSMDIESIVGIKRDDNMKEIYEKYKILYNKQKESIKYVFISIKPALCDKYIEYFEGINVENLFCLKQLINFIKSINKKSEFQKDINKIIHETGLKLSKEKKLENKDLLNFIRNDDYYNDSNKYGKKIHRPLEILNGLNVDSFDDEFYIEWKKIDWSKMFDDQYVGGFLSRVSNFINDLKNFKILFKLLDISKNQHQQDFNHYSLITMQTKFTELYKASENPSGYDDDLIKLIFYSDQKNANIEDFLTLSLHKILKVENINKIYITLMSNYKDLITKNTKNIITDFFTKNPFNKQPNNLLYLIKNCPELSKNILQSINMYNIQKEYFLKAEEEDNLKLFKGLLEEKYLEKNEYQNTSYVKNSITIISEIEDNIKKGEILYKDISKFYNSDEKENNILYDRLKLIALNKEEDYHNYKKIIDDYYSKINQILNDLVLINEDLMEFFYNEKKKDVDRIKIIIEEIKNGKLNDYKKYNNEIENFISEYKKSANSRSTKKKSAFFQTIFKNNKGIFKAKDQDCINETEKIFDNLMNIFSENGVQNLDKDDLKICLETIKGKKEEKINEEIDTLINIFGNNINKFKFDKNLIVKSMIILSKKEDIYKVAIAISIFIEKLQLIKGNLWTEVKKIIEDLENKNDNNEKETIENSINKLEEENIDIKILEDKNIKNNYLNILLLLKEQPEAIDFIVERSDADCRNMQEFVGENDNAFLNSNDILDLEKCVEFRMKLGDEKDFKNKKDKDIIMLFKQEVEKIENIELYFTRYVNNYIELKNLWDTRLDKSQASKKTIELLCKESIFRIRNEGKFFEGIYYEDIEKEDKKNKNNQKGKEIKIKMYQLIELRDRAQLTKKVKNDEEEKKMIENYKKFVERVSEINNICSLVKKIQMSGYPETIEIKIKIEKYFSKFSGAGLENVDYKDLTLNLQSKLDILRGTQLNGYKDKSLIRFIYGRQFNLIINTLKGIEKKGKISPFLMFLTNNLITNKEINFNYISKNNIYDDMINNCEQYLHKILESNRLTMEKIYSNTLINKKSKNSGYQGVFLKKGDKLEKNIFQIYKYLTNNTPMAQNILLCNRETSIEELTAFLYRSILCEFNSCFIIGGVELLENDRKSKLIELLNKLYVEKYESMKSCLIILCIDTTSDILKSLDLVKYKKILPVNIDEIKNLQIDESNVEIISSDVSGVGKSTQIKLEIEKSNRDYIYFPLGGVFNREDIIKRLKDLSISNNSALHLDLYDTDEIDLMMEFLFSILITKLYGRNEDIFYLPREVEIKIEIPNGFINFFEKFPILTLFPLKKYSIKNLKPLIVSKEIHSNVQVVANYLKALKDDILENKDLYFDTISDEAMLKNKETTIKGKILSQQECQQLIFEQIKEKIKEPNYYQISSFIDVLAVQFKKFSRNNYFHVDTLKYNPFIQGKKIRSFTIQSFILLTRHFTEGVFTDIVKSQQRTHDSLFGFYDENKDNKIGMEKLAEANKEKAISFKDIDPSLVFFHEGNGLSFSIITNKERNDQEYINLRELRNCNCLKVEERKELPNYKKYENIDFLKELSEILDIPNPITRTEKEKNNENNGLKKELNKNKEKNDDDDGDDDDVEEEEENEKKEEKEKDEEENEEKELKSIEEITKNYVFTPDNFIKMALILLRIRADIPVIMMGETGCGKTSLIRKLSELLNNGSSNKMKILNIHAGISDKDIINFLEKKVINEAKKIEKKNEIEKKKLVEGMVFVPKKLWVFFDEINTCKSMGLISEIMCKHTYQGKKLPSNIVFIAACNPYRQGKKMNEKAGLNINQAHKELQNLNINEINKMKKTSENTLVYTVNPLPHSLLNFVFNFGKLDEDDEVKYIEKIIYESMYKIYFGNTKKEGNIRDINEIKDEDEDFKKLHEFAKDLIVKAQNFIRNKNDISSVSLREIRRFNIFYEFFFDYLTKKKNIDLNELANKQLENEDIIFYKNSNEYQLQKYSIILAVFICYYLRITDNKTRNELVAELNKILKKFDNFSEDFLYLPNKEENYIIKNIELPQGIAKNKALLDNVFSLFIAINNKVPIFIVGKPGCSKSLSVQLINKSMKGTSTNNILFKGFPKIILNSYQGSMGSTSKGVLKVFKKARRALKRLKEEDKEKNISMIFFDEMGLAEHSPNNPLKVIHSQLEYDLNEGDKKIAFVGISNWALDASKMNRGMYLSIPEPEENDVKLTAYTIGESYDEVLAKENKSLYENLGLAYYKYKQFLKKDHCQDGKDEFHGNRDFYHLVKNVGRNIKREGVKQIDKHILDNFSKYSIERNFGGLQFDDLNKTTSIEKFKNIFSRYYENLNIGKIYEIKERIKENINDYESRYLLIISKSSVSISLLESILSKTNKEYCYYIGSQFENDQQSEEYSLKILNKIQLHMEQGNILILKNLESVYPALYDLFNQNFTEVGKKNYARIAIGSSNNAFSYVHEKFRCIVNVDENQLNNEEPPFLNRFEKHILSYDNLLIEIFKEESMRIYGILNEMIDYDKKIFKGLNYSLKEIFINSGKEEIQELVYKVFEKGQGFQSAIYEVIKAISLILPQDIILCQRINGFQSKYQEYSKLIIEEYNKGEHTNLKKFLEKMDKAKNVVYTFSNILDYIEDLDELENPIFGKLSKDSIEHLKISDYKSENEFEKDFDFFLNDDKKKICLIKFKPNEGKFINYIKFFIGNKEKDILIEQKEGQIKKAFVFIVHLSRINNSDLENLKNKTESQQNSINNQILKETISLASDYYQIFIDNLNGDEDITLENVLKKKGSELYELFLDLDSELKENIYTSLSYMKYNCSSTLGELNEKTYVNKLIEFIKSNEKLVKDINKCLKKQLNNEEDVISKIFKSEFTINHNDIDMISVIQRYLSECYTRKLSSLYYKLEQNQFFSTLLSAKELNKKIIKNNEKENNNEIKNEVEKENNFANEIIERTREEYLNNLDIINEVEENVENAINKEGEKNYQIVEKPGMNDINIILGLKLPGVKSIISSIIKKIKNEILRRYKSNENSLRGRIDENKIDSRIKSYKKKLKVYNEAISLELDKSNIISKITNDKDSKNKFFDLFLEDYYILFIDKYLNKTKAIIDKEENADNKEETKNKIDYYNIKQFLKFIVKKRIESNEIFQENEPIKMTASTINWIESYSLEISNVIEMFYKLNKYVDNLFTLIKDIINNNEIKYEISKRSEYTSIVNKPLFYSMESILKVTTKDLIYKNLIKSPKDLSKLLKFNREIFQLALKMEGNYDLFSKEVYSLQEIIIIFEYLILHKKVTPENLETIITFFSNESVYISSSNEKKIMEELKKLYETLLNLIGNDNSFNKIISIIFKDEFIKITDENFRKELCEFIMKKDELIYNNKQIFKYILYVENEPGSIINNKKYIFDNQNKLVKCLNDCRKPSFEETIINIIEFRILNYFEMIPKIDFDERIELKEKYDLYYKSVIKEDPNETLIVFNSSLEIFKECVDYLDSLINNFGQNDEKKNYNLYKLYAISYIKIYISKLAHFVYEKEQYIPNIKEIIDIIKGGADNKFRTVLKIYVFKLFYHLTGKNLDNMIATYNLPYKGFDFVDILLNKENDNKYIREIICEENSPTIELYKDFPLLKYFTYAEYRKGRDFIKELGPEEKYKNEYPLLFKYLKEIENIENNSNVNKLEYLHNFNEFSNYMIEYYSFKISREEAKEKTLNQEPIFSEQGFKTKFNAFLNAWNKIKSKAVKYKEYPKMDEKNLNEDSELIYFLNDENEQGFGMYLAAAYENFIKWQNEFLEYIINHVTNKDYFNCYLENMKKTIPIQDACSNQIINLNNCFEGVYDDFEDLLNIYSKRKIFNKDGTINFSNYNLFEYDITSIEEELAYLILPGKCLFEKDINYFVTFWGEGFNGGKSNILQTFCKKHKQTDLVDKEKNTIVEYFRNEENKREFKPFFISIQLIIFYLINNEVNKGATISYIIDKAPEYLKIDESVSDFFNYNEDIKKLEVSKILSIFSFFEHLCYNDLCETLQNDYKMNIDDELTEKIKEKLLKGNENNGNITIKDLAVAVRRFISRYLVGRKQKTDIEPKSMLLPQLKRVDLWNEEIWNCKNLDNLISNLIGEFKLTVGQSYNFYEIIKVTDPTDDFDKPNEEQVIMQRQKPKEGSKKSTKRGKGKFKT